MKQILGKLITEDAGQDLIEYAFLAVFIALAVIVGLNAISSGLNTGLSSIGSQVATGS
jgi:Flp pilus assembly pilin Flp